ncbi:hypothetical protein HY413_02540 [Candidatus Kaiserbacteria bacterium]|nr:hypothetical protein [Candidatus Kaiserbacteria bacterium]
MTEFVPQKRGGKQYAEVLREMENLPSILMRMLISEGMEQGEVAEEVRREVNNTLDNFKIKLRELDQNKSADQEAFRIITNNLVSDILSFGGVPHAKVDQIVRKAIRECFALDEK